MPDVASSIMAELKAATRAQHEATEDVVGFEAATRDLLSYRHLLEKFYGFYAPTEQKLQQVSGLADAVPDIAARMKTNLLRDDIKDLGRRRRKPAALPKLAGPFQHLAGNRLRLRAGRRNSGWPDPFAAGQKRPRRNTGVCRPLFLELWIKSRLHVEEFLPKRRRLLRIPSLRTKRDSQKRHRYLFRAFELDASSKTLGIAPRCGSLPDFWQSSPRLHTHRAP